MKSIAVILLVTVVLEGLAFAEVSKLDLKQREMIQTSDFRQLHSVKELPAAVLALCADNNGRLADPGQRWQVTDAILDKSLPRKRLIWAAVSKGLYVVHYERGGIAHSYHVLLVKEHETPNVLWHGIGSNKLENFNVFKKAVEENRLDDRSDYTK